MNWPADFIDKIICGDCLDVMEEIPDGSVDCVITDPPWPGTVEGFGMTNDEIEALWHQVFLRASRIARRVVIHLGCDTDPRFLAAVPRTVPFVRVCWLRYVRPHYKGRIMYNADVVYVFGDLPRSMPGRHVIGGEMVRTGKKRITWPHPCPRSVEMVQWLVNKLTDEDDVVLDPLAGIGTTAVACLRASRKFIAIDKTQAYCDTANERLEIERRQLKLIL